MALEEAWVFLKDMSQYGTPKGRKRPPRLERGPGFDRQGMPTYRPGKNYVQGTKDYPEGDIHGRTLPWPAGYNEDICEMCGLNEATTETSATSLSGGSRVNRYAQGGTNRGEINEQFPMSVCENCAGLPKSHPWRLIDRGTAGPNIPYKESTAFREEPIRL